MQACRQTRAEFLPLFEACPIPYVMIADAALYIKTSILGRQSRPLAESTVTVGVSFLEVNFMVDLDELVALLKQAPDLRLNLIGGWGRIIYDLDAARLIESRLVDRW
jgi:hypothetical protein